VKAVGLELKGSRSAGTPCWQHLVSITVYAGLYCLPLLALLSALQM